MIPNKMTISELKNYIISEAKKLYEIEILKEEKKKIESILSEIDRKAMNTAKKDIEKDGDKFEPLGKNKFEKNIDKKELKKAMSPESVDEGLGDIFKKKKLQKQIDDIKSHEVELSLQYLDGIPDSMSNELKLKKNDLQTQLDALKKDIQLSK